MAITVSAPVTPAVPAELSQAQVLLTQATNQLMLALGKIAGSGTSVLAVAELSDAMRAADGAARHASQAEAEVSKMARVRSLAS